MPKPMLFQTQVSSQANHRLDATLKPETTQETRTVACERVFRKRRSQKYIDAMSKLDAGSGHISQEDIDKMIEAIREEFPDIDISTQFFGCMAVCHLGAPYEVHTLVPNENCIIHYHANYSFEAPLDKCRNLCLVPDYIFVEIYDQSFRAISKNGAVAQISAPGAGAAWKREIQQPCSTYHGPHEAFI